VSHFVKPETRTLHLDDGETIVVRRRLNAGEQRAMFQRMYVAGVDGRLKVNPLGTAMATVTAFLLDWSLCDDDGQPVAIAGLSPDDLVPMLDALDPDVFSEIRRVIDAHADAQEQQRQEEKKLRASSSALNSTFRSAV
jgi:hypothetical protein